MWSEFMMKKMLVILILLFLSFRFVDCGLSEGKEEVWFVEWEQGTIKSSDGTEANTNKRIRTDFLPVGKMDVVPGEDVKIAIHFYTGTKEYIPEAYIPFTDQVVEIDHASKENAVYFRVIASLNIEENLSRRMDELGGRVKFYTKGNQTQDMLDRYGFNLHSDIEMVLYTEFDYLSGKWNDAGELIAGGFHSQLLQVKKGEECYIGYCHDSGEVAGAFFDAEGNFLRALNESETYIYKYMNADGNHERDNYASIYVFRVPVNARYISLNLTMDEEIKYRQYLSSKPVFALENTGNYVIYEGNNAYQAKKDKRLCVIGASGVTIDRLYTKEIAQFIVGFQEYLVPWYQQVDSYGFWSGSWAQYNEKDTSIYSGIVDAKVDLSMYDEFLLIPSTADVAQTGVGEIDSQNISEYMGGLNGMIRYIYDQVPDAKIYLVNVVHKGKYFTTTITKERMDEINDKLQQLSAFKSYQYIDLMSGMGINDLNYDRLTYDGTHLNQEGNKLQGLYIRKELLGF